MVGWATRGFVYDLILSANLQRSASFLRNTHPTRGTGSRARPADAPRIPPRLPPPLTRTIHRWLGWGHQFAKELRVWLSLRWVKVAERKPRCLAGAATLAWLGRGVLLAAAPLGWGGAWRALLRTLAGGTTLADGPRTLAGGTGRIWPRRSLAGRACYEFVRNGFFPGATHGAAKYTHSTLEAHPRTEL